MPICDKEYKDDKEGRETEPVRFSIWNYEAGKDGVKDAPDFVRDNKPSECTLLTKQQAADARKQYDKVSKDLRPEVLRAHNIPQDQWGKHQIHHITPIKYGGDPTAISNLIPIDTTLHQKEVSPWFDSLINKNLAEQAKSWYGK